METQDEIVIINFNAVFEDDYYDMKQEDEKLDILECSLTEFKEDKDLIINETLFSNENHIQSTHSNNSLKLNHSSEKVTDENDRSTEVLASDERKLIDALENNVPVNCFRTRSKSMCMENPDKEVNRPSLTRLKSKTVSLDKIKTTLNGKTLTFKHKTAKSEPQQVHIDETSKSFEIYPRPQKSFLADERINNNHLRKSHRIRSKSIVMENQTIKNAKSPILRGVRRKSEYVDRKKAKLNLEKKSNGETLTDNQKAAKCDLKRLVIDENSKFFDILYPKSSRKSFLKNQVGITTNSNKTQNSSSSMKKSPDINNEMQCPCHCSFHERSHKRGKQLIVRLDRIKPPLNDEGDVTNCLKTTNSDKKYLNTGPVDIDNSFTSQDKKSVYDLRPSHKRCKQPNVFPKSPQKSSLRKQANISKCSRTTNSTKNHLNNSNYTQKLCPEWSFISQDIELKTTNNYKNLPTSSNFTKKTTNIDVPTQLQCSKCSFISYDKKSIYSHERSHKKYKQPILNCPYCKKKYTKFGLRYHIEGAHLHLVIQNARQTSQRSQISKKTTRLSESITNPLGLIASIDQSKTVFKCRLCSFNTDLRFKLIVHAKKYHSELQPISTVDDFDIIKAKGSDGFYNCPKCSHKADRPSRFKLHLGTHLHSGNLRCHFCKYESTKNSMVVHVKRVHDLIGMVGSKSKRARKGKRSDRENTLGSKRRKQNIQDDGKRHKLNGVNASTRVSRCRK